MVWSHLKLISHQQKSISNFSQFGITRRLKMNVAYIRAEDEKEELKINLRFVNKIIEMDREFSFIRKKQEEVKVALLRIQNNISKEVQKSQKKILKKHPNFSANLPDLNVEFWKDGEEYSSGTLAEMLENFNELKLNIGERSYEILINQPWCAKLALPNEVITGALVYPSKLELEFAKYKYSKAQWFRAPMPRNKNINTIENWNFVSDHLIYQATLDDNDYLLKLVFNPGQKNLIFGPEFVAITSNTVKLIANKFPFMDRHKFTEKHLKNDEFRVMSYNILADLYGDSDVARDDLFSYCKTEYLNMGYRKQLLMQEILGYNADIICLQEVDNKIFKHDLTLLLDMPHYNYKGIHKPKIHMSEGAALFYRSDRFEYIETSFGDGISISSLHKKYPETEKLWEKISLNKNLAKSICERGTILMTVLLRCKDNGRFLLIANTHLYFHPNADLVRLIQFAFSIIHLEMIIRELIETSIIKDKNDISIIYCGDFNSGPTNGIYKLATKNFVEEDYLDFHSNTDHAVKNVSLKQPYNLKSAYGTPAYTNYTEKFKECLDYIFFQTDSIELLQTVPLPAEDVLTEHVAIPSCNFPSDHCALIADFKFK